MKREPRRTHRLPLTVALGLAPLLGYSDSRNMAAQADSREAARETTLYRLYPTLARNP